MAKARTMRDENNNIIYPQTAASVVYTADGNTVNDIILKGVSVAPVASVSQTPEVTENKVTSLSSTSSNTQYPSAKATYDFVLANKSEGLKIEVVQVLPTTDIDTKTLYLVPKAQSETGDSYDEYIYVNNQWEHLGSTEVDLSQYAKKTELPTKTSDLTNDSGFIDDTYHDTTKQNALISGTNIKTINNESILGSGNIVIQGGGEDPDAMRKANPTGTGSISINRKANTTVGTDSSCFGYHGEASGTYSYAEGFQTVASGGTSHAEGFETTASGAYSHAEGCSTEATASYSHAEGLSTIASSTKQHVQGVYNAVDDQSVYADIIGNGVSNNNRKNIEATTWTGDKRLKGNVYVECNDDSTGGNKLATEAYINNALTPLGGVIFKEGEFTNSEYLTCDGQILNTEYFPEVYSFLPRTFSDPSIYSSTLPTSCTKLFWAYNKLWACDTVGKTGSNPLYYSENYGRTWETANLNSLSNTAVHNLVYSNGCMILTPTATATIQSSSTCFYSFDGINWTRFSIDGTSWTSQTGTDKFARACYGYFNDIIFFRLKPETKNPCYGVYYNIRTNTCGSSFEYPIISGIYPLYDDPRAGIFLVYNDSSEYTVYEMYGQGWDSRASGKAYGLLVLDNKCVGYPSGRSATGTTIGGFIYESSKYFVTKNDFINNVNSISMTANPNNFVKLPNGDYCNLNTTTFTCYSPIHYKMPTASTSISPEIQEYMKISTTGGYINPWTVHSGNLIPYLTAGDVDDTGRIEKDGIIITYNSATMPISPITNSWQSFDGEFNTGYDYYATYSEEVEIVIDLGREIELGKWIINYDSLYACDANSAYVKVATSRDGVTYTNIYSLQKDALAYIRVSGIMDARDLSSPIPLLTNPNPIRYIKIIGKMGDKSNDGGVYLREFNIVEWAEKEENNL